MSKFVLLFVVICLFASVCYAEEAKRVRRDLSEDAKKAFDDAQETLKGLFTKENWDKVVENAKDLGTNLKKVADDVVAKVSEKPAAAPEV